MYTLNNDTREMKFAVPRDPPSYHLFGIVMGKFHGGDCTGLARWMQPNLKLSHLFIPLQFIGQAKK